MLRYFGLTAEYPFLGTLGEIAYYSLACMAGLFVVYKLRQRLLFVGHNEKQVTKFVLIYSVVAIPAAYLSSRAAGMFYRPMSRWSIDLFLENIRSGGTHTYHASIILPLIILSIFTIAMKYRYLEVMDTVFLYVPIGHSIGRAACLIVGCCWGRSLTLGYFGHYVRFTNPVPLYAILINFSIFFFLRRLYRKTYFDEAMRRRYTGCVVASYLLLYGVARIVMEIFRKEKRVVLDLTQAQVVMALFMLIGLFMFAIIRYRRRERRDVSKAITSFEIEQAINGLFSLLGVVVSYLFLISVAYYLTRRFHILQWPFFRVESVADAYGRIMNYMPMILLPIVSLYWLRRVRFPILQSFKWTRFSRVFYLGLAVSALYPVDLLLLTESRLRGIEYWPPVLILCLMNAFCEEIVHRLAILNLLKSAEYSRFTSIIIQGVIYSVIHFMLSPMLGVLSLLYGFMLGVLMDRTNSVAPCVICHFIVDLGGIGRPLLAY